MARLHESLRRRLGSRGRRSFRNGGAAVKSARRAPSGRLIPVHYPAPITVRSRASRLSSRLSSREGPHVRTAYPFRSGRRDPGTAQGEDPRRRDGVGLSAGAAVGAGQHRRRLCAGRRVLELDEPERADGMVRADPARIAGSGARGVSLPARGGGRRPGAALGHELGRARGRGGHPVGRRRLLLLLQLPAAAPGGPGCSGAERRLWLADALCVLPTGVLLVHAARAAAADRPHGVGAGSDLLHGLGRHGRGVLFHRLLRSHLRRRRIRLGQEQLRERGAGRAAAEREATGRGGAARRRERHPLEDAVLRRRKPRPAPAAAGDRHLRLAAQEARDTARSSRW